MPAGPRTAGRLWTRHLARKLGNLDAQNTRGAHTPPSPLLRVRHTFAAKRRPQAGRPPLLTPRFSATRTFIYIHIYTSLWSVTSRYTVFVCMFVLRYIFCQLVAGPLHPQRKAVQIYPVPFQKTPRRGAGPARTRAESLDLGSLCGAVAQDLRMGNEVSGLDCCGQGAERGREGGREGGRDGGWVGEREGRRAGGGRCRRVSKA